MSFPPPLQLWKFPLTIYAVLDDPVHMPSPRYWLVWPGTMLLLAGSFAEVFANYKSIYASVVQLFEPLIMKIRKREMKYDEADVIEEPCPPEELVPMWMWGSGIGKSSSLWRSSDLADLKQSSASYSPVL